jgi:penicillin-binding protein 2
MPRGEFRARPSGLARLPGGQRRLWLLRAIVLGLLVLLVARLWDLQVLASEHYQTLARDDFVRNVVLPATRGELLDRTGKVVVGNQTSWSVLVDPGQLGSRSGATLNRLASLLGVPRSRIDRRLRVFTSSPFAIPVAANVDTRVLFELAEHADQYPGVSTEPLPVRSYRDGAAAAQVLGYVGPVTADELRTPAYRGALPGDDVGRAGVEQAYDQVLRGRDGLERLEVDAQGKVVRVLGVTQPVAGENLRLTIDLGLQRQLDADLARQVKHLRHAVDPRTGRPFPAPSGAAVVLDPRDGSVLAMSSYPSYDPSVWVGGISEAAYRRLTDPAAQQPLLNRAISGLYAPGSTFKLVTATAALDDGLITPGTIIDDPGSFTIPGCAGRCSFHNDSN